MDEIAELVRRVEACELPLQEWTHRVHLTVSTWFLTNHGLEEGTRLMRDTIQRFNAHNGIEVTRERGYHETLTLAWLRKIDNVLKEMRGEYVASGTRRARVGRMWRQIGSVAVLLARANDVLGSAHFLGRARSEVHRLT